MKTTLQILTPAGAVAKEIDVTGLTDEQIEALDVLRNWPVGYTTARVETIGGGEAA